MKKVIFLCVLVVCLVSFNASAGVIAHYSFDVNAADDSGLGHHAYLQWGAVAGVADAERGLVLDLTGGTDNRVYVPESGTTGWCVDAITTQATIMMWAKMEGSWADTPQLFGKAWSWYMYGASSTSSMIVEGRTDAGWIPKAISEVDTADGQWHHYAATIDNTAGVYTIFVDGVEKASQTFTGPVSANAYNLFLGQNFNGYMDDAIIFDEALDEAAIQVAMDTPIYELVAYYDQPVNDDPNSPDYPYAPNIVMVPGESFTYNYVLTDDPDPDVIEVTIIPDSDRLDLGEGAGVSKVLSFDTTNWDVPQPVTVTAVVEEPYPGDAVVSITHSLGGFDSEDPNYVTLVLPADLGIQIFETAPELECGTWGYVAMDFNTDCYVNLADLAVFAAQWLVCTDPLGDGCIQP